MKLDGFYGLRNLGAGTLVVGEVNPIVQFCFAMGARVLGIFLSSKKNEP